MCIFAGPVQKVENTRIAVFINRHRCFTAYQMAVELAGQGNAMILPVPTGGTIQLVDMSRAPTFFDDLNNLWPVPQSRGMTRSLAAPAGRFLDVHKVGSYEVSIAEDIDDIKYIDPSVFTLSKSTEATLWHSYKGGGYSFVVAKLSQGGEMHPLGYIYDRANTFETFIPTKHAHGDEKGLSVMQAIQHEPDWDHTVYLQGPCSFVVDPKTTPQGLGATKVDMSPAGARAHQVILDNLVAAVPELEGFLDTPRMYRTRWVGRLRNIDAILVS